MNDYQWLKLTLHQQEVSESQTTVVLKNISPSGTWVGGVAVGRNERKTLNSGDEIKFPGSRRYIFFIRSRGVTSAI